MLFPQSQIQISLQYDILVRVVDLGLLAQEFPLSCLVGEVSTGLVPVFFGLKEGEDMES